MMFKGDVSGITSRSEGDTKWVLLSVHIYGGSTFICSICWKFNPCFNNDCTVPGYLVKEECLQKLV